MMRKLYWKIFFSFWITTTLIILTITWAANEIANRYGTPLHDRIVMNSYSNAVRATYESGHQGQALNHWIMRLGKAHNTEIFLINSQGKVFGELPTPPSIATMKSLLMRHQVPNDFFKSDDLLVSKPIETSDGERFRILAFTTPRPSNFLLDPIQGVAVRVFIAILISGIICYILSRYLTQPLHVLQIAAKAIAKGHFNTRVGTRMKFRKDEIGELAEEFDNMASQLEQLATSKQRLIQDISHELRSPLARLQVALELARSKTDDIAENEFKRMELEANRLNELISDIFSLAQLNRPTLKLTKTKVNLVTLLQDIVKDANYEFSNNKPRVHLQPASNIELKLDKKLMRRAFENIVRNALRYSTEDSAVEISIALHESSHPHVIIIISDHGPGVPENELEKIFEPFHRVDTSRTKQTGGYGLGLAIVKQAIQLHHGTIRAYNRTSGGLIVEVNLPGRSKGPTTQSDEEH